MSSSLIARICAVFVVLRPVAAAAGGIVLNEVLYDPAGADGGEEFVELFNSGEETISLAGWRLQFANGAVGEVWSTRWTGADGESLAPGGYYLIVDQGWAGAAADAVVSLGLQNGPDALRLTDGEAVIDLLGWGDLEFAALSEGTPHPGAGGGASLARRPDGHDTDDNAADWRELAEPTPGVPNYPPFGLEIVGSIAEPPSLPASGWPVHLAWTCVNAGVDILPAARVELREATGRVLDATTVESLAPDAAATLAFDWTPELEGLHALTLIWPLSAPDSLRVPAGAYRCGPGDLLLSEVMAAPTSDACEWVEIVAIGEAAVDLSGYALADEGGAPSALPDRILETGERLILVQDAEVYEAWWDAARWAGETSYCPNIEPRLNTCELAGAWPTLNNTPPDERDFADRVYLTALDGHVVDHVTLGAAGAEVSTGRSLERGGVRPAGDLLSLWGPCTAQAESTPGCRNSREADASAEGDLVATSVDPGSGAVLFSFDLRASESSWTLVVYDLAGLEVRSLGGDALGAGPRRVLWDGLDDDGRPPPPEALVALLVVRDAAGGRLRRHRTLVVTDAAAGR